MVEVWKDVVGYEGYYQVSNFGRIYSLPRKHTKGGFRKFRYDKDGYARVDLYNDTNKGKVFGVHRLVAIAFIPNPNELPMINHKDENPKNNRADNLEWCNCVYNNNYGTRNIRISLTQKSREGRKGKENPRARKVYQFDKKGNFIKVWECINDALKTISEKAQATNISACCNNKLKSAYGYVWRYTL